MIDSQKIKQLMQEKRLRYWEVAQTCGFGESALSYALKRGDMPYSRACKLADALGVSLDELRKPE